MNKYEAMFIIKPELTEDERKVLFNQISEPVIKNSGTVTNAAILSERKKLFFPIKKHHEGVYYVMSFSAASDVVAKLRHTYSLNENILRVLIIRVE